MKTIDSKEYKCACKEVYIIINNLDEDIRENIPREKIEFYQSNMDKEYNFEYNYDKGVDDQNILYITKCILANLFKDYIASEEDKQQIIQKEQEELRKIEQEKLKKFNPDEIWENKRFKEKEESLVLVNKKLNIFQKIKNIIETIFKKHK